MSKTGRYGTETRRLVMARENDGRIDGLIPSSEALCRTACERPAARLCSFIVIRGQGKNLEMDVIYLNDAVGRPCWSLWTTRITASTNHDA